VSRSDIVLRPADQVCVAPVRIDATTAQVQVLAASRRPGTASLEVEASAPGYRGRGTVTVPTTPLPQAANARIQPPAHDSDGKVCVTNRGDSPVSLFGTNEAPAIGVSQTSVDGRDLGLTKGVRLALLEAEDRSVIARLGTIMHRAADFTGGLMPVWLAWPLLVLLVLGTPFAIFGAFWLALREEPS
jgi:hypothetical protein